MALEDFKFYKIRLDRADMTMAAPLTAKEGAVNGNGIELQIINGSVIEDMSGIAVYLNWKHQTTGAQGSEPFTLVDINNGVYQVHYPTEMLAGGVVRADIKVVDAESITVSTAELLIRVNTAATDTAVQSANVWNDIQTILVNQAGYDGRFLALEAAMPTKAAKPTNEATATTNTVLASNGDGTGTFKNTGAIISGATAKTTPVDADTIALSDSAATSALKKLSWLNIKATLKAYFDTLYATIANLNLKAPLDNPTFTGTVQSNYFLTLNPSNPNRQIEIKVGATDDEYVMQAMEQGVAFKQLNLNPLGTVKLPATSITGLITTAGQIKFPATQNPSADPNTLDDYEEGTFTGLLTATTQPTTQQTAVGYYTKKGQEVTITIAFENKNMSGSSGILAIYGLPFLNKSGTRSFGAVGSIGLASVPMISTAFGNELRFYNSNNLADILTANANGIYVFATITYITA